MSVIVTSLPAYVEQNTPVLIGKSVMGADSLKYMTIQTGVKSTEAINILKTDMKFGDGASCGWNAAGTDTFTQRDIVTGQIKVNKSYCDKTMLGKYMQDQVKIAAGQEVLPFEQEFAESNARGIAESVEKIIWQGDTSSSDVNLKRFDGLLKILGAESTVLKPEEDFPLATAKFDIVKAMLLLLPAKALKGARIFASPSFVRAYGQELVAKNWVHFEPGMDYNEFPIPGSNVILTAVEGLEGTATKDYIVAANPDNLFYGCDMESDREQFDVWYSKDNQEFRLAAKFNAGVQVAFPDEVVLGAILRA